MAPDEVARLYGQVLPIDAGRIIEATHQLKAIWGRELLCLDTPGHAKHHICIVDRQSGHLFTGDTFGLVVSRTRHRWAAVHLPDDDTDPVRSAGVAHESLDLIMSYRPEAVYLTHFSQGQMSPPRRDRCIG